jgi:hypothetical protein
MTTTTKKEKVSAEVKNYVTENINEMAESHIECWKDRYFRKSKKDISFDLNVNHDSSLEIERVEEDLKRKLNDVENDYVISQFNKAVVKAIY